MPCIAAVFFRRSQPGVFSERTPNDASPEARKPSTAHLDKVLYAAKTHKTGGRDESSCVSSFQLECGSLARRSNSRPRATPALLALHLLASTSRSAGHLRLRHSLSRDCFERRPPRREAAGYAP